jgi:hypothetical protein
MTPEEIEIEKIKFEFPKSVIDRYINAEHEWRSMLAFIRENSTDCSVRHKQAPNNLKDRYSLSNEYRQVGLAWYLLDEYFKGNITIKEDAQPE